MFTILYTEWWGYGSCDGNVTTATNKTHKPALTAGFYLGWKNGEYGKPRTEWREVSYGKIGLTTVAVTQDLLSVIPLVLKIELIRLWNRILPEPGQPSAQLPELICLTACKKAMPAISWWNRTVYAHWLVASEDIHKDKRWLNSEPPHHKGPLLRWPLRYFLFVSRGLVSRESPGKYLMIDQSFWDFFVLSMRS